MDIAEYCLQNIYWILRNTVTDYSTDIVQYCIINSMDIAHYYPQNIPWTLHSTPHKIPNCYCSIISKVCSMDITECCLQNIYWILRNTVTDYSIDFAHYCIENSMDIAQYYPQNIPWILHSTPHKILNCYCSIISQVCSMDIIECCLQNIYWILRNNVHRFARYSPQNFQWI